MEAAQFVVSDAATAMWTRVRAVHGPQQMVRMAVTHLRRWESEPGWTRHHEGWVSSRETTLAASLAELLVTPDLWTMAAQTHRDAGKAPVKRSGARRGPHQRDLDEWRGLLVVHTAGFDDFA